LSPFLFLVYINDMADLAAEAKVPIALFADDVAAWPDKLGADGDAKLQRFLDLLGPWATKWKILFGQSKSQVVRFTRSRALPEQKRFSLAGSELEFAASYKYLGVILQGNLKWDLQIDSVIQRANSVSALISNSIVPGKPPGFRCVRALVEALLMPLIQYGMPIWQLNERQNELDQLIARPLRRCLSLPQKSTHALSVIVESGLLSASSLFALSALRLGGAVWQLNGSDPVKSLLFQHNNSVSASIHRFSRNLGVRIDDPLHVRSLRHTVDQWQLDNWSEVKEGSKLLKGLKTQAGPSSYLLSDERRLSAVRARLRFDRASLNASLAQRSVLANANCPTCGQIDTVEHCLLECPRFLRQRNDLDMELQPIGEDVTLATILASDLLPKHVWSDVQLSSGRFLLAIDTIRKL
jgi:hypothetical protein